MEIMVFFEYFKHYWAALSLILNYLAVFLLALFSFKFC